MKMKLLGLTLISASLVACGVTIEVGTPASLKGDVVLPQSVASQSSQAILSQGLPGDAKAVPGEYLVKFNTEAGVQGVSRQGILLQRVSHPDQSNEWALVRAGSLTEARNLPGVEYAQPNYLYRIQRTPNDPLAQPTTPGDTSKQWYLGPIGAYEAWDRLGEFTTTVKVAVIDDGYRPHQDMPAANFDLSNPECNTQTGQHCLDVVDFDNDPSFETLTPGEASHGMAVAGIIGATTNNGVGMAGLGWNKVKVVPIKISTTDLDNEVSTSAGIANAFNTAIIKKSRVINFSFCLFPEGGAPGDCSYSVDPAIEATLKAAYDQNVTVVVAAGNQGQGKVAYPASSQYVISVGATDASGKRASFSNYGEGLDLVAPGAGIRTLQISNTGLANQYGLENGTSFSAPIVAGAAALLYSRNPNLTVQEVRQRLIGTGDTVTDPTISNAKFLRIDKALTADKITYVSRVILYQNGAAVRQTSWSQFAPGTRTNPYAFGNLKSGTYSIVAEVAENGFTNTLLYKCVKDNFSLVGDQERDLAVGSPSNPPQCF